MGHEVKLTPEQKATTVTIAGWLDFFFEQGLKIQDRGLHRFGPNLNCDRLGCSANWFFHQMNPQPCESIPLGSTIYSTHATPSAIREIAAAYKLGEMSTNAIQRHYHMSQNALYACVAWVEENGEDG